MLQSQHVFIKKGIEAKLARVLKGMMDQTTSCLSMAGQCSDFLDVIIGVGHGILSLQIFLMFISPTLPNASQRNHVTHRCLMYRLIIHQLQVL
jgi:hypothetical protein